MNEELKRKLDSWKITPAIPAEFQRVVWQQIAAREAARLESGLRKYAEQFFETLATPRYAVTALLAAIVIGTAAAHLQADQHNARLWNDLQTRYTISVDPAARAFRQ